MIEDGEPLLAEDFGLPIHSEESSQSYKPGRKSDKTSSKKFDFTIVKMILGIIYTVMRKYRIVSSIIVAAIVIFLFLYGFWISFAFFLCGFLAVFYNVSDQLVYWPNFPPDSRHLVRLPSSIGLPSENLFLYAKDGTKLHAVFVKQDSHAMAHAPTFIYFHGNAGNIGHRLGNIYDLYRFLGVNILVVEYRGFGLSEGSATETGIYMDAEAAVCYVRTRTDIDVNKIVLFGRSLGGAVAIDCAVRAEMRSRVAALVVENTFTSIPDMTKTLFAGVKILTSLPVWCHKNKFKSKLKMCRVVVPTLLLSGQADTLVPPTMMKELYRSCSAPGRRLIKFKSGTHNETWRCHGYYQVLGQFLEEVLNLQPRTKNMPLPPGVVCVSDTEIL